MAIPAMQRPESDGKAQEVDNQTQTFTMADGRQIEYTLDGERRLLEKADQVLRALNERKGKRRK